MSLWTWASTVTQLNPETNKQNGKLGVGTADLPTWHTKTSSILILQCRLGKDFRGGKSTDHGELIPQSHQNIHCFCHWILVPDPNRSSLFLNLEAHTQGPPLVIPRCRDHCSRPRCCRLRKPASNWLHLECTQMTRQECKVLPRTDWRLRFHTTPCNRRGHSDRFSQSCMVGKRAECMGNITPNQWWYQHSALQH